MKPALEQLGYLKTHHMVEVLSAGSGAQLDYWDQIGQGEAPDWHAVFDGYQACVDFPACGYWRELAEAFPEAKVILNVRDFDAWYASADATIFQVASGFSVGMRRIPRIKKSHACWMPLFGKPFSRAALAIKRLPNRSGSNI